jgi:LacI family transcriptional regulator
MSTIRDVARRAGVSTMTVSRVINRSGYTSQETRARVERAVVELGYVPNALARHLRSKRTRTVALVLSDLTNPFFTTIARGVEDVAASHDFAVMFCNTDESESEEMEYLRMLIQRQIDGVLLVPASSSGISLRLLRSHGVPVVIVDRRVTSPIVDEVRSDSEAGAYQLVRHLIDLGHRRIAMLSGSRGISTSADRVGGYQRALNEAGVAFDEGLVLYEGFGVDGGLRMGRQLLDLSGRRAAELMLERLAGGGRPKRRSIILPVDFIVRRSTAPPRSDPDLRLSASRVARDSGRLAADGGGQPVSNQVAASRGSIASRGGGARERRRHSGGPAEP